MHGLFDLPLRGDQLNSPYSSLPESHQLACTSHLQQHPPQPQSISRDPHHHNTHHVGIRADQGRQELCSRTVSLPSPTTNIPPCYALPCPFAYRGGVFLLLLLLLLPLPLLLTILSTSFVLPFHPSQPKTIHTTAITMVTRPTPTSANTMDTRTPQNTPAQNAPISSRAQAPSVSDIKEGTWYPTCFGANRTVRLTIFEQRTSTAPPPLPSSPRTPASFQ